MQERIDNTSYEKVDFYLCKKDLVQELKACQVSDRLYLHIIPERVYFSRGTSL